MTDILKIKHAEIVGRGLRWLKNTRNCSIIITEFGSGFEIPDVIGWASAGWSSIVLEAKVSLADFKADIKKPFRKPGGPDGMGAYRYYIVPADLKDKVIEFMPPKWGLLYVGAKSVFVEIESEYFESRNWQHEMAIMTSIIRRIANTSTPLKGMNIKYYSAFETASEDPRSELYVEMEASSESHMP